VRVHADAVAEQSARDVNAHAYTIGNNVVFGAGQFAPETRQGRRLIAHELVHVVQQGFAANPPPQLVGDAGGALQCEKAEAPILNLPPSPEEVTMHAEYTGPAAPACAIISRHWWTKMSKHTALIAIQSLSPLQQKSYLL
jgi:hypothetical protein